MADGHCFISYSTADALEFARKLANKLEGGTPSVHVWFDKDDLKAGRDWDIQIDDALKSCRMVLFVMTKDSTHDKSVCRQEWSRALSFKKPIIPLWVENNIDVPFRLADRQRVDFRGDFDRGLAQLRDYLSWLDSPEGVLQGYKDRLLDAERDLQRTSEADKPRILSDIEDLKAEIKRQEGIVANPKAAEEQTKKNIEAGLERERNPEKPVAAKSFTKFINPPPGLAPNYFQDRYDETKEILRFLNDDSQRLMTIVGRGGVGKTAMVCRLLKGLEGGELPDGLGRMRVEGIVYLSESGSHRVNFANLFYDLCKLLPADAANALDAVYKNPQASTASKMSVLLDRFTAGKVVLLLDNVEPLISVETFDVADAELDECLRALLHGAHSALKVILTTRVAPRGLNLCEPGRQRVLTLDSGLEQKYAIEMLREMDVDGKLGLKAGTNEMLGRACERTLGFPRALEALFAILASDRYTTLEELLAMPTPVNVVEALVGEAFNRLDTNAQKVMQALAVYNRPVTPAAVDYLLAPHLPAMDSAPILRRLVNMHFVRRFEGGKFYLHPMDSEFAYNLLPEGSSDDIAVEKGGLKLFKNLWDLLEKYPDLLQNQDTFNQAVKNENANIVIGSVMALKNLDASLVEKMQQEGIFQDENFLAELDKSFHLPPIWSRYALNNRAADYFAQARKPRAEWKKLDDLSAQLAEFDLRCAAGDYDTAARVLTEIDFDYLYLWGHYKLLIGLYKQVIQRIKDLKLKTWLAINLGNAQSKIGQIKIAIEQYENALALSRETKSRSQELSALGNLGNRYSDLGNPLRAIENYEKALVIAREIGAKESEGRWLGGLGNRYSEIGNVNKSIEYQEQALNIAREIGNKRDERVWLGNLGVSYNILGDNHKAIDCHEKALIIAREIGERDGEAYQLGMLAGAFAAMGDIHKSIEFYEEALKISHEIGNLRSEAHELGGLAGCYETLGQIDKAIECEETSLNILIEIDNKNGEGASLSFLGSYYANLGNYKEAKEFLEKSLEISRQTGYQYGECLRLVGLAFIEIEFENYEKASELALKGANISDAISIPDLKHGTRFVITQIHLLQNDLVNARATIEAALGYDVPENNHNVSALHGIIALRQGDEVTARGAFVRAIGQADEILSKTAEYYSALDAKGLALCGRAVIRDQVSGIRDQERDVAEAIETFRKARKIAPHAGVVKSVLRLFDELVKCDSEGILKDVRSAIEGTH